jgi:predicted pyridoxine 5'-phosphate oxidase superfamily flavin-nucleotide-binding protein
VSSRFHPGELTLQRAIGAEGRLAAAQGVIRDFMLNQHRELFEKLPTLFVATLDAEGQAWASVISGPPGFISTPDDRTLVIGTCLQVTDPGVAGLRVGAPVGLLGIELHTRRRNRANGLIGAVLPDRIEVQVKQSFGNCPKYIYARRPHPTVWREPDGPQLIIERLSDAALQLIAASDTLFIASSSAAKFAEASELGNEGAGIDISHRGGLRGFVTVDRMGSADRLMMPDYVGNSFFNTLGNLVLWPHAGLLFIDWQAGHLLQLAVEVELQTSGEAIAAIPGAQRLVHMTVVRGTFRPHALALKWSEPQSPPQFSAGSPFMPR